MDLNAILQTLTQSTAQSNQRIDEVAASLGQDTARMQELMTANTADLQKAAALGAQAGAQKAAITYEQNTTKEKAQAIAGLNPADQENEYVRSMAALTAAQTERAPIKSKYDQLTQISFLDNPVGYLMAQLELPQVAAQHNALVDRENAAQENVLTRTRMLQAYNSTTVANTAGQIQEAQLKEAEARNLDAQVQLRNEEMKNGSLIAQRKMQMAQLEDKKADNLRAALGTQLSVAQFQMSLQDRQEAREERAARMRVTLAEQKDKDLRESQYNEGLARVSKLLGLPIVMDMKTLKQMPNVKMQQAWLDAATTGSLGSDLRESLGFVHEAATMPTLQRQNPGFAQAIGAMDSAIKGYGNTLSDDARKKTGKPLAIKDLETLAPKTYAIDVVEAASNPGFKRNLSDKSWDNTFNPYRAPHTAVLQDTESGPLAALKDNVMVKALTTVVPTIPPDSRGFRGEDEARAVRIVGNLVAEKKLTAKEAAAQVSQYYRVATGKSRDLYGYEVLNLPPQTRYNVTVQTGGWQSAPVNADLLNTASVERLLTRIAVAPQHAIPGFAEAFNIPRKP